MSEYARFFTEDELETLYDSRQPVEGDILLLNSTGATGFASRTAGQSKYSHVGLVIGSDLYIDAVAKHGVNVRRVSTLPQDYDINACVVVRNRDLVMRAPGVWSSALDYLERPYRLRGIFTKPNGTFDDRDPVICSKLVGMILRDAGLTIDPKIYSLLPRDFDLRCRGRGWIRFPLLEYDIVHDPGLARGNRSRQTDYWLNLTPPVQNINKSFRQMVKRASKKP